MGMLVNAVGPALGFKKLYEIGALQTVESEKGQAERAVSQVAGKGNEPGILDRLLGGFFQGIGGSIQGTGELFGMWLAGDQKKWADPLGELGFGPTVLEERRRQLKNTGIDITQFEGLPKDLSQTYGLTGGEMADLLYTLLSGGTSLPIAFTEGY